MASAHAPTCVFQETRLNLDPPGSVVNVSLNGTPATTVVPRHAPKRRRLDQDYDETAHAAAHFATDASIHFRAVEDPTAPSTILWRVLEHSKLLELQPVDLSSSTKEPLPAWATLRFSLPDSILPSGVLLTAPSTTAKSDTLVIYIFTKRPDLYKLTLRKECFSKPSYFEDENIRSQWLTKCTPSILSYRHPYRAHAISADELWVSLNDGGFVKLQWDPQSSYKWTETRFAEGNWKGSLMGMIRKTQPTVRFGDFELDARSAAKIIPSPTGNLAWTACLDHTLRAWDVASGKMVLCRDLAGDEDRDLQRPYEQPLEASQPDLFQLVPSRGKSSPTQYQLVIYSPVSQAFSFWLVDESDPQNPGIQSQYTSSLFAPPIDDLLNVSGWRLDQYCLTPPHDGRSHHWDLWLLVRCAGRSSVLNLRFSPTAKPSENRATWEGGWSTVHPGTDSIEELGRRIGNPLHIDQETASVRVPSTFEQWVAFIFHPGRFSSDLLEAALGIYRRGQPDSAKTPLASSRISLEEDICMTVGSSSVLQTSAVVRENFLAFERDIAMQWSIFYGVIQDLQKQKERFVSLAYDAHNGVAWTVSAGQVSPIRASGLAECLWQNHHAFGDFHPTKQSHNQVWEALHWREADADAGKLLRALKLFTDSLPHSFLLKLQELATVDYLSAPTDLPIEDRMQNLYSQSGFNGLLADDDYTKVVEALELVGGFENLSNTPFDVLIQALTVDPRFDPQGKAVAPYGMKVLAQGARDLVFIGRDILLGIIAFVVFTAIELDPSEVSPDFSADVVYAQLTSLFVQHSLLDFLTSTSVASGNESRLEAAIGPVINEPADKEHERAVLTLWIRRFTFAMTAGSDIKHEATSFMANMIKQGNVQHADALLKFMPADAWACYIQGRYYLAIGDIEQAAEVFKNAAEGLAIKFNAKSADVAGLLQPMEQSHFGEGLLAYYQHILNLFESGSHMSYTIDFAKLALEYADPNDRSTTLARTDIHSRLFTAAIQLLRFNDAFDALVAYVDPALRRSALATLLNAMIASSRVPLLTSLDFPPDLAADADAHLAMLAASPSALSSTLAKSVVGPAFDAEAPLLPAHQILYAFRSTRGDFRGAAEALWEHIQQVRLLRAQGLSGVDIDADLGESYLGCINALELVDESMRWLLVRPVVLPETRGRLGSNTVVSESQISREKRALVSLDDVRKEWQKFLDWQSDLAAGRYALDLNGEEDDEMLDGDGQVWGSLNGLAPPAGESSMEVDDPFVA